jgi:MtN3 and saliva related transmembrane protein
MNEINLLGLAAGTLTTMAFVPQVVKTWQSKSAADISFGMFLLFSLGLLLWLLYGLAIHSAPIIVANSVTLILAIIILALNSLQVNTW